MPRDAAPTGAHTQHRKFVVPGTEGYPDDLFAGQKSRSFLVDDDDEWTEVYLGEDRALQIAAVDCGSKGRYAKLFMDSVFAGYRGITFWDSLHTRYNRFKPV